MPDLNALLGELLRKGLEDGCFPSACCAVGRGKDVLAERCAGEAPLPGETPANRETLYDMASLTKVLSTTMLTLLALEAGQLELNVMEPIIVYSILESIVMMVNGMDTLREKCILGITANKERCRDMVYHSIGLVTALNPYLGYETSTELAKEALTTGKGIYDLVLEKKLMSKEELDNILRPENMVKPRKFLRK